MYNNQTAAKSKEEISVYQDFVSKVLEEVFDIKVKYQIYDNGHTKSKIDLCKGTVNSSNIESLCTSNNAICGDGYCHDLDQMMEYFASDTSNDLKNKNVLWSNNLIQCVFYNEVYNNRSCEYMGNVYMLEKSKEPRVKMGVLLHEVAHLLGAKDHYHETDDSGNCVNKEICTQCGTTKRPESCIMNKSSPSDLLTRNIEDLFCDYCKADILSNIEEDLTQ